MRAFINGAECEIPTQPDGSLLADDIRRAGRVPPGRGLVLRGRDMGNRLVNKGQRVYVNPGEHFTDMPISVRG